MRIALVAGQQRLTGVVTKGNFLDDGNLEKNVIAAFLKLIKLYMQGLLPHLWVELYVNMLRNNKKKF